MDITEVILFLSTLVCLTKQGYCAYGGKKRPQPVFLRTPTNVTAYRGETVVLQCHVKDLGTRTVVWRRNDSDIPLTIGETVYVLKNSLKMSLDVNNSLEYDESTWNLILKDVTPENSGIYLCQITASKMYLRYITLEVLDGFMPPTSPPKAVKITGSEYANELTQIRLHCEATGVLAAPAEIDWYFKGNKIHTSKGRWFQRASITKQKVGHSLKSELIVARPTTEDAGIYVCRSPVSSMDEFDSIIVHVLNEELNIVSKRDGNKFQSPAQSNSNKGNRLCDKSPFVYIISIYSCSVSVNLSTMLQYLLANLSKVLHYLTNTVYQLTIIRYPVRRTVIR